MFAHSFGDLGRVLFKRQKGLVAITIVGRSCGLMPSNFVTGASTAKRGGFCAEDLCCNNRRAALGAFHLYIISHGVVSTQPLWVRGIGDIEYRHTH
jgi:hypothetical protein